MAESTEHSRAGSGCSYHHVVARVLLQVLPTKLGESGHAESEVFVRLDMAPGWVLW